MTDAQPLNLQENDVLRGRVKIGGHSVELAEIEDALRSPDFVKDAKAVLHQEQNGGEVKIMCLVTLNEEQCSGQAADNDLETQHVENWIGMFDSQVYSCFDDVSPEAMGRDFKGWKSMYNGSDIDRDEMNEWLDDAIETIIKIEPHRHILEIGTGSGMVLFNLVNRIDSYIGLEPSAKAFEFITSITQGMPSSMTSKIKMFNVTAASLSNLYECAFTPDIVVINSVVQYFPNQEYLLQVIRDILHISSVKTIFLGDIRSRALYRQFLAARTLCMTGDEVTPDEVQEVMASMEQSEPELLVNPAFFTGLVYLFPNEVEHVEVLPKKIHATNELSAFRYAVVVHIRARRIDKESNAATENQLHSQLQQHQTMIEEVDQDIWLDFMDNYLSYQSLSEHLQRLPKGSVVAVSNIPHSKSVFERFLVESLDGHDDDDDDWISRIREKSQRYPALSAVELAALARETGYQVEISWARQESQHGGLDAIFHPGKVANGQSRILFRFPTDSQGDGPQSQRHSIQPLSRQMDENIPRQLREILQARLLLPMVPVEVLVVDKIP
ncbi:hypothetical protein QQS21_003914 [Conoideocrella luteorostrata]|uniref:Enniatin synthetase n=1 Tax=Conoideocrella luteorostrata TaxID=1105319 RepID=A0AAJ0FV53_9HYPO|nr:hypothetical protein QQS21_003914 [Conoideocrella luteorostrata]